MRFLLDTNIISDARRKSPAVLDWLRERPAATTAMSAISVLELEIGVARIERRDVDQGRVLRRWLEERVLEAFRDRILPVDAAVARRAVAFHVPDPTPERDALIAATAVVHDLVIVTRNVKDFERAGVDVVNPLEQR